MKFLASIVRFLIPPVVAGLAIAFIVMYLWPALQPPPEEPAEPTTNSPPAPSSYADAVNRAAPSVVSIYSERVEVQAISPRLQRMLGRSYLARSRPVIGSGVLVSSDGYLLTNEHVISQVQDIQVALWDGRIAAAQVVGTDPETDLAVLKIELNDLPASPLTVSTPPRVGDVVLAIGNALGLSHTVTMGIVSATGRNELNSVLYEDFIQTDAAINAGSSGGALINASGEVIGINTRNVGPGAENIGFAIPISLARDVLGQIIQHGMVRRGWLGAVFADLPTRRPDGSIVRSGVQIREIAQGGPAELAGLQPGDVILSVDGQQTEGARALVLYAAQLSPGTEVVLQVSRDGRAFETRASLVQQPPIQP